MASDEGATGRSNGSSASGRRVLVLEDDPVLLGSFGACLRRDGHRVDQVRSMAMARAALRGASYDCLVVDRLVVDGDALDLVADLREWPHRPPVLVLSGLGALDQRLDGLRAGADDYVAKPVRLAELSLRVRQLVEAGAVVPAAVLIGSVVIDRERQRVSVDGKEVHLTPRQRAVLEYLVAHRHRMVSTEELLEHCWDGSRSTFANPLHSQVTRLRRLFSGHLRFESVRGAGYLLEAVAAPAGIAAR